MKENIKNDGFGAIFGRIFASSQKPEPQSVPRPNSDFHDYI